MKLNLPHTIAIILMLLAFTFQLNAQNRIQESSDEVAYTNTVSVKEEGNTTNRWDYFIYPVPANDVLNIKITKGDVSIDKIIVTDEDGKEVIVIEEQYSEKLKLNLDQLKAGKYFIQIVSNEYQMPKMKRFYIVN